MKIVVQKNSLGFNRLTSLVMTVFFCKFQNYLQKTENCKIRKISIFSKKNSTNHFLKLYPEVKYENDAEIDAKIEADADFRFDAEVEDYDDFEIQAPKIIRKPNGQRSNQYSKAHSVMVRHPKSLTKTEGNVLSARVFPDFNRKFCQIFMYCDFCQQNSVKT